MIDEGIVFFLVGNPNEILIFTHILNGDLY